MVLVGASFVLAACGADTDSDVPDDRQFANDPAPTRVATEIPTTAPTAIEREPRSGTTAATPADLLQTRGAPSTLYTISDGNLYALNPRDGRLFPDMIALPSDLIAVAVAASPTGDRAGVALVDRDSGSVVVRFFDEDGQVLGNEEHSRAGASPAASPAATPIGTPEASPVATSGDASVSLSWEPQGNGVLLVSGNSIFAVDIEAGTERIESAQIRGSIVSAVSSPMGSQILVHTVLETGEHRVYVIQRQSGEVAELFAARADAGTGLAEVGWLPTGNGIVFVRGDVGDGGLTRGQLFLYLFREDAPRLLATAGQGGPSATIRNVAVAPDGSSVAYEVAIFDIDRWSTHSMWIRSIKHGTAAIQLPVESGHTVTDIAWSDQGLVWRYTAAYGPEGDYAAMVGEDGDVWDVVALEIEPAASPAASPGATPMTDASPGASPIVTSIGTPDATPVE